jgi:hypothetical protein
MFLIIPFHKPTLSGIYYKRRALSKDSFLEMYAGTITMGDGKRE